MIIQMLDWGLKKRANYMGGLTHGSREKLYELGTGVPNHYKICTTLFPRIWVWCLTVVRAEEMTSPIFSHLRFWYLSMKTLG